MNARDFARFLLKIDTTGGTGRCWPFGGARTGHGYGNFWLQGKYVSAHRAMYMAIYGPVPIDLEVDHLCHDGRFCAGGSPCPHRSCVNPLHLGLATRRNNVLRGASPAAIGIRKTHCPKGHPYDRDNTYRRPGIPEGHSRRDCRPCRAMAEARRRARVKAQGEVNSDHGPAI